MNESPFPVPRIYLTYLPAHEGDRQPYKADILFQDGRVAYTAVGATPDFALMRAADLWTLAEELKRTPDESNEIFNAATFDARVDYQMAKSLGLPKNAPMYSMFCWGMVTGSAIVAGICIVFRLI